MNILRRLSLGLCFKILFFMLFSNTTQAWCVANKTSTKFHVTVFGGGLLAQSKTLDPGSAPWCCKHGIGGCYAEGTGYVDAIINFRVNVTASGDRTFACEMTMDRAGHASVYQQSRADLGIHPNYYCRSYHQARDKDGNAILQDQVNTYGLNFAHRDVRFLASGDPQMDNGTNYKGSSKSQGKAAKTQTTMWEQSARIRQIRGIIVAGDLTESARLYDEFDWYLHGASETIDGVKYEGYVGGKQLNFYEGLGNHDVKVPDVTRANACAVGYEACINPKAIRNYIRNKHRSTVTTLRAGTTTRPTRLADGYVPNVNSDSCDLLTGRCKHQMPHYSWDWHDVHFVMLNNFAARGGDGETAKRKREVFWDAGVPNSYSSWYIDHYESLEFLENDLESSVGSSNRPVVIVQHYGMDPITQAEIYEDWEVNAFWKVIADYNVIAIIHGHSHHLGPGASKTGPTDDPRSNWHNPWPRPYPGVGFDVGPDHIDTFNASASHEQSFLDVQIDDEKMTLKRMDNSLTKHSEACKLICPSTGPTLHGIPDDITVECDAVPAVPPIETISATTACGTQFGRNRVENGDYAFWETEIDYAGDRRYDGLCEDEYVLERTWKATDTCGNTTRATQVIRVVDTKPPGVITDPGAHACLSPPNHKLVEFGGVRDAVNVLDNCDPAPTVNSVNCTSNECDNARCDEFPDLNGDGYTTQDCQYDWNNDVLSARSERSANGDGRTYSVHYTGIDRCGNESPAVVGFEIDVPKSRKKVDSCAAAPTP